MTDLKDLFLLPGFVESGPYIEKIKAFEQYFLSQIELYDKVHHVGNQTHFFATTTVIFAL